MAKIFIDGSSGTTGLRIYERLSLRDDIELISLSEETRRNTEARLDAIRRADIAFLCLPDEAAAETVRLASDLDTVIIDTSTAHRTHEEWEYGFPELSGRRQRIANSKRIANPGCHASGFIALVTPLTETGVLRDGAPLSCFSLTGYSGGGKKMIAEYEAEERAALLDAPRQYGLTQHHKHLKEMVKISGIDKAPVFCPIVAPYYSGMEVTVTLFADDLRCGIEELKSIYRDYYKNGLVSYRDGDEDGFLSAGALAGRDDMYITVSGNDERILLISRFDNLGKGASGSAIQNMNILLGLDETTGLNIEN